MEIAQSGQSIAPLPQTRQNLVAEAKISSDFETFLKMLTAQMKNQDPLNPLDGADFAVQLATFSGVEQQVQSNQLLEGLSQQLGQMSMAQLAGWVGMEARVSAPAWFAGSPITLHPEPAAGADQAVLVVRNNLGVELDRVSMPASSDPIDWAGVTSDGTPLPPGLYRFEMESYRGDEYLSTSQIQTYSRISEARNENGETLLILQGGIEVTADEISALRAG